MYHKMTIEVTTKKWGNSMAVVLPREFVLKENLMENEKIRIDIKMGSDLSDMFGKFKDWKINSQKVKDDLRKEEVIVEERKWKHLKNIS